MHNYPVKYSYDPGLLHHGRTEFYPKWEQQTPYAPGYQKRFPIYSSIQSLAPGVSPRYILGEHLHALAKYDPWYQNLMKEFVSGGPRDQTLNFLNKEMARYIRNGGDPKGFEDWMDESGKEAWARGTAIPDEFNGREWVPASKGLPQYQQHVLEAVKQYVNQQPGQTDLGSFGRTM